MKWKFVPETPTDEMVKAAGECHEGEAYLPYSLYKAMLAAAPQPEHYKVEFQKSNDYYCEHISALRSRMETYQYECDNSLVQISELMAHCQEKDRQLAKQTTDIATYQAVILQMLEDTDESEQGEGHYWASGIQTKILNEYVAAYINEVADNIKLTKFCDCGAPCDCLTQTGIVCFVRQLAEEH